MLNTLSVQFLETPRLHLHNLALILRKKKVLFCHRLGMHRVVILSSGTDWGSVRCSTELENNRLQLAPEVLEKYRRAYQAIDAARSELQVSFNRLSTFCGVPVEDLVKAKRLTEEQAIGENDSKTALQVLQSITDRLAMLFLVAQENLH